MARQLIATQGQRVEPEAESISACLLEGKQGFWLDIESPDASDYELLEKTFKFHPLALEDIPAPTFLTGFFGMNFAWLVAHLAPAWTFWVLAVGVMLATSALQLLYYRSRGWI